MGKATTASKGKTKIDPDRVAQIVSAMSTGDDEQTRIWHTANALGDSRDPDVARAVLDKATEHNAARHWLSVIAGTAGPTEIHTIAELAATAKSARIVLAETMGRIVDRLEPDLVARAAENLAEGVPFAPFVLDHGRRAALTTGRAELAAILEARAAFTERFGALLADLDTNAQEKKQKAAVAKLSTITGSDRDQLLLWLLDRDVSRDAKRWARLESISNPAIPILQMTSALNDSSIYDEEEKALGERIAASGPAAIERASAILDEAIGRYWLEAIEHLSEACPKAFATERGFAAVMRGLDMKWVCNRLCEDGRRWIRELSAGDAATLAEKLVALSEQLTGGDRPAGLGRAFFYFRNPGGLQAFVAALDKDVSLQTRDELYDAIYQIPGRASQDVLIERLWREQLLVRDLIFSFIDACMPHRHADVLARLDREPSIDAAWAYVGAQVNWGYRPRHVIDVLERVLEWPITDRAKRDFILSTGVKSALELRRYDLAKRALAALGDTKETIDPTDKGEAKPSVIADKELKKTLDALRSGKLEADHRALLDEIAKRRAAGTPRSADDERLGMLAGGVVLRRVHDDPATHEVWFFDTEGAFFYYDGFGIAQPPPFELAIFAPEQGWHDSMPGFAELCKDWRVDGRSLHVSDQSAERREVIRSGTRIAMRFFGDRVPVTSLRTFGFAFPDEPSAERAFEALRAHPLPGFRAVDPFYIPGKRGGTWVRVYGLENVCSYVCGLAASWGPYRTELATKQFASREEAIAHHDAIEADAFRRGLVQRKLELDDQIRPETDKPLDQFIDERYRDDNQDALWHLRALPAIREALAGCQLPLDDIEVTFGPPATEAALAAYDAVLPEPMHESLRATWRQIGSASWRVGNAAMRLLSPTEVVEQRAGLREDIRTRLANTKRAKARDRWQVDHYDVLVVDGAGEGQIAWDVRQQEVDCFETVASYALAHYPWNSSFGYVLSEGFNAPFVKALRERFPAMKKLKLGQSVDEVAAKSKSKPAAKKSAAMQAKAKSSAKPNKQPAKQPAKKPVKKAARKKR